MLCTYFSHMLKQSFRRENYTCLALNGFYNNRSDIIVYSVFNLCGCIGKKLDALQKRHEWLPVLFAISHRKSAESLAMISPTHRNYSRFASIASGEFQGGFHGL